MELKKQTLSWHSLYLVTFMVAYIYIANEWLFAITKPSYFNYLDFTQQLEVFLTTSALLASLCFIGLLPLGIISLIPLFKPYTYLLILLGGWLPALILAALILILVDNFTYTIFKFGIVSTEGWIRGLYGLGFILVILLSYQRTFKVLVSLSHRARAWVFAPKSVLSLLTSMLLLSIVVLVSPNKTRLSLTSIHETGSASIRPHILLITSDGLEAKHMSVYGYHRETTPNIRKLADSALVAENAFSNSGKTTGSVLSIYTGKYPMKTRVLFPPDILKEVDSYEHLPGILRSQGYRTVQITSPHYVEASKVNLLDGFDEEKTSSAPHSNHLYVLSKVLPSDKALFIDEIIKRLTLRINHIFFVWKMDNPYLLVTGMERGLVDIERWEFLKQELRAAKQPIFIHIHLMGTHGPQFKPIEQVFSAGQDIRNHEPWSDDFFDDSILEFDAHMGELVDYLIDLRSLDNTIIIIGSDHGQKYDQLKRLPLIIRFPHGQYAGRVLPNNQNLDIAPTVLDYLDMDKPNWMQGDSLIAEGQCARPIIGVTADIHEYSDGLYAVINWEKMTAPFYQFAGITLIYCQEWFKLDLTNLVWETGNVEESTTECPPGSEIKDQQAFQLLIAHLLENGFDVSALNHLSP
jgi:hypothetical protein